MQLIFEDKKRRTIRGQDEIRFSSSSSFHLVSITARARGEKQISKDATDDEELVVKIDDKTFPKLGSKATLLDSPAAFNGGQLHNLSKTIYFLAFLGGKEHTTTLETDKPPYNTATLESIEIYTLNLEKSLKLDVKKQAEDGDRRDWLTFVLDDLPLKVFTPTITYSRRKWDSDDVKTIIDGKTQGNLLRNIRHFLWRYAGSLIPKFSSKTETETFIVDLSQDLHYIEFHADRMPTVESVEFDFGETPTPSPTEEIQKYKDERYNQYDNAIIESTKFWNQFFLEQKYPPPSPLDPNLVKAAVYVESRMGHGTASGGYPAYPDIMQVWDERNKTPQHMIPKDDYENRANEFVSETEYEHMSYSYPEDKKPRLYHKAQKFYGQGEGELVPPYKRQWLSWRNTLYNYNSSSVVEPYLNEVLITKEMSYGKNDADGVSVFSP